MRNEHKFSVHSFGTMEGIPFNPQMYSLLKFGCDGAACTMGYELADAFFNANANEILQSKLVVIPSPYNYVKNAATIMSEHFVDRLNHHIILNGGNSVEWCTINRKVSYIKDYGFLDAGSRKKLIDGDQFYFSAEFVKDKTLIFIDDVCITGTHEDKLKEILDKKSLTNNTHFLYYAQYNGSPDNANIEAELNFSGIKNTEDFIHLTHQPNHHVIVRPIKYLMSQETEHFSSVISKLPNGYIKKLYKGCLAENYQNIPEYRENFSILQKLFN